MTPDRPLRTSDFFYELPEELIAKHPLPERDASRMMVLHKGSGKIEHRFFRELPDLLRPGDLAVLNNSRVIRARLKEPGKTGEVFLAESLGGDRWLCLVRPGRRWPLGNEREIAGTKARVEAVLPGGERILAFASPPDLERHGSIPLPPYLRRNAEEGDSERYQNIFAAEEGSVAAPTAGLHFTPATLEKIPHCFLTLHVGLGTFQPIKSDLVSEHKMHKENYFLSADAASAIRCASENGRVLAVGTTSVRVLESQPPGPLRENRGTTDIFIYPPFSFQRTDLLLTNFHLPDSTLLLLVSAFAEKELVKEAYRKAVEERYRFFSYGDCMLILP